MHGFATTADAEKFLAGAKLRDAMRQAGVQGSDSGAIVPGC
jgi:hypothetical protein